MKKLLVLGLLFAFAGTMNAQDNRVKLGIFGLGYKNINLKYERVIGNNISVQANVGFRPNSSFRNADEVLIQDVPISLKHSVFTFIPEFRYYFNRKDNCRGVYGGFNLDYMNLALNGKHQTEYDYDGKIGLNYFGAGVNLGVQWLVADRISIDWHLFSLGYGSGRLNLNYATDDPDFSAQEAIDEINEQLVDIPGGIQEIADVISDNTSLSAKTPPFGLFRLRFGLSIGYAF